MSLYTLLFICIIALLIYIFKFKQSKTVFFTTSIIYIVLGVLLVPTWYIYVGIGFVIFGIVLFLFRNLPIHNFLQILVSILPILFISIMMFLETPSENIFLIPKGYTGRVLIIHDCKTGAEKERDGFKRVYRINKNGILKSRFSFAGNSFDFLNSEFYYIDENGKKETILYKDQATEKKIFAQGLWSLKYTLPNKGTNIDFIIDKPVDDVFSYESEFSKLVEKELKECE
jgi:hypothetical protein